MEALSIMAILFIYAFMVVLSSLVQILDVQMPLFMLMVILVFVFIVSVAVSGMLLKHAAVCLVES